MQRVALNKGGKASQQLAMFGQLKLFEQIQQLRVGNVGFPYLLSSYKLMLHVIGSLR
jgi:hypothetical protein